MKIYKLNTGPEQLKLNNEIIYRTFGCEALAGSIDEEDRSLRMIASTESIDSYGDVVVQSWDLRRYIKNAAVLYNHNSSGWFSNVSQAETIPIGRSKRTEVVNGHLEFEPKIGKASPLAETVWQALKEGTLSAASVGFRPGAVEKIRDADGNVTGYRLGSAERPNVLYEISIVPIGANEDAVGLSSDRDVLERIAEMDQPKGTQVSEENMLDNAEKLEQLEQQNGTLMDELSTLRAELASANDRIGEAETRATEAAARADGNEDRLIELEIAALVGKKITPAEVEVAKSDRKREGTEAFAARMAARADLPFAVRIVKDGGDAPTFEPAGSKLAQHLVQTANAAK